ncbi:MAG TPA: hypothetical protein VNK24_02320 [Elusimicrobiota bacterium]|nr:hypothetical protein [Elusimicrobiota bacterium]
MKKRLWKPPQPSDASAAVDIPELKEKEKKKQGVPFWTGAAQSPEAVYGSLEGIPGVEASQAAASAAVRTAASAAEAAGGISSGGAVEASSEAAGGFLSQIARSVLSYWPESLAGKIAAAGMMLVTAGALAGGASLFAKAASSGVSLSGLGGIVSSLHYRKPPSKSLLYAAAAARNMPSAAAAQQAGVGKAEDAVAAGGFTGQVAPGVPVGQKGGRGGPLALNEAPWSGQNFFNGSAGSGALTGGAAKAAAVHDGKVGGAFEQSVDGKGVGGALVAANTSGSPFARLGGFGAGLSQSLGLLRSMKTYIPGMTSGGSVPDETPAQLAAEQFDHSNLIGASAPSAPSIGNGTPNLLTNPNAGGGSGSGVGNNSCAQDGMVWNGSGCVSATAPPGSNAAPWQSSLTSMNTLLPIAAGLMILAAILSNIPWGLGKPIAYVLSIIAAILGGVVLLQGTGMIGGGQNAGGGTLVIAGVLTAAGAWAAFAGSMKAGPSLVPTVIGAVGGLMSLMTQSMTPTPQTPPSDGGASSSSSGGDSSGSSSSSGSQGGTGNSNGG